MTSTVRFALVGLLILGLSVANQLDKKIDSNKSVQQINNIIHDKLHKIWVGELDSQRALIKKLEKECVKHER